MLDQSMLAATTNYGLAFLLLMVNAIWLVSIVFGLPGTWLMALTAAVVAWIGWDPNRPPTDQFIGIWALLALVALALVGEVLEFIAGAAGAKKAGGSLRGTLAAILGGIVGAAIGTFTIPIPLLGSLLGAAGGAGLSAWGVELASGRSMGASVRIGWGAGVGRLMGTLYKMIVGVAIWLVAAITAFWP